MRSKIRFVERRGGRYRARRQFRGRVRVGVLRETVEEALADALAMDGEHGRSERKGLRVDECLREREEWLRTHRTEGTLHSFGRGAAQIRKWIGGDTRCTSITPARIHEHVRTRMTGPSAVKAKTVAMELQALFSALQHAVALGLLRVNPMAGVKMPRWETPARHVLTAEEVARITARIEREDPWTANVARLLFLTGLRRAELARLRREDIDAASGSLHVRGKTGVRALPITAEVRPLIDYLLGQSEGGPGAPLIAGGTRLIERMFGAWRSRLGDIRWHPHALRHSYATALARAGVPPHHLAALLGHRTLQMSMAYVHAAGPDLRAAASRATLALSPTPPGPTSGPGGSSG